MPYVEDLRTMFGSKMVRACNLIEGKNGIRGVCDGSIREHVRSAASNLRGPKGLAGSYFGMFLINRVTHPGIN